MSIRLRLALWYGALTGLVLLITALVSYAFHNRGHYNDFDRTLAAAADHAVSELVFSDGQWRFSPALEGEAVTLRIYDGDGNLLEEARGSQHTPPVAPQDVLRAPAGPAFDALAALAPPLGSPIIGAGEGAFGLIIGESGQRWRIYVTPVVQSGEVAAYVEASASLEILDDWMRGFRRLLFVLGLVSLVAVFAGSWATASGALRPIRQMASAAQAISHSRDPSRQVEVPPQRDELFYLAEALNEMLGSLDAAYRAQQRFVSDASHELRAPLTAIQANLELIERHPDMPVADREEAIREASREARRLTRLVADLLALARADTGVSLPQRRVELDQVILEAVNDIRHLAKGQNIAIEKLEPAVVAGDPDRLKQLLVILLDNAIKYTSADGSVLVSLSRDSDTAEVTVLDTGIGIPGEAIPHLFERFFRADPARARDPGGTGLGLAIARWIVEQHHGEIEVASTLGEGTTVRVTLPVAR